MADYGWTQTTAAYQAALSEADSDFNGQDVLVNDLGDYMTSTHWHELIQNRQSYTIYFVGGIETSPSGLYSFIFESKGSGSERVGVWYGISSENVTIQIVDGDGRYKNGYVDVPDRSKFIFALRNEGHAVSDDIELYVNDRASLQVLVDGNARFTGSMALTSSRFLGYTGGWNWEGKCGGLFTFPFAQTTAQMDRFFAYLNGRFGTPINS